MLIPRYEKRMHETITYKKDSGFSLYMYMVKPAAWRETDKRTAIVWIHGGGWKGGNPESYLPHCHYFANRGAVVFSVQYRLISEEAAKDGPVSGGSAITIIDCLQDCESAIRYLRTNASRLGIRPDRIVVAGDSAGGYLAVCMGTSPEIEGMDERHEVSSAADLVVNCNGVIDLTRKWKFIVPQPNRGGEQEPANEAELNVWAERHQYAKLLSPLYRISPNQPPMLILHGLRDTTVEPEDAVHFYDAYIHAGNKAELILYPTLRHAFILYGYSASAEETNQVMEDIDRFLTAHHYLPPRSRDLNSDSIE